MPKSGATSTEGKKEKKRKLLEAETARQLLQAANAAQPVAVNALAAASLQQQVSVFGLWNLKRHTITGDR